MGKTAAQAKAKAAFSTGPVLAALEKLIEDAWVAGPTLIKDVEDLIAAFEPTPTPTP